MSGNATAKQTAARKNHLAGERSPYLKQHAGNPVDWYPWGDEALSQAKQRGVPLFLSSGYSTCYWCHVMARECFEDSEVAAALNNAFVCVKIDREQRPDIDSWLMDACLAINGSGGWPLNVLLTPGTNEPFWAGTFVPKMQLLQLVARVETLWTSRREDVLKQAAMLREALAEINEGAPQQQQQQPSAGEHKLPSPDAVRSVFQEAAESLAERFDVSFGGFGRAPKFPSPHNLTLLLRLEARFPGAGRPLQKMAEDTLLAMRRGGLWDHVGSGFHRYATDPRWLVPHFEKMLYDQASLALAYTDAFVATGIKEYKDTALKTFEYVQRCLAVPDGSGAHFSAEDAETDGVEGKFYLWNEQELKDALGDAAPLFLKAYSCQPEGAALHLAKRIELVAEEAGMQVEDVRKSLDSSLQRLFEVRERRTKLHRDDNVLCSWNAFMAVALAHGARVFGETTLADRANACIRFLLQSMCSTPGDLDTLRHYPNGVPALLDDHAFLLWALCETYQATFFSDLLDAAGRVARAMDAKFSDPAGAFFMASGGTLPGSAPRKRETDDSALPSGNSAAAMGLLQLWQLADDDWAKERAERLASACWHQAARSPLGHTQLLQAYDMLLSPQHVAIRGVDRATAVSEAHNVTAAAFVPTAVLRWEGTNEGDQQLAFQVCKPGACMVPVHTVNDVVLQLLGK